MTDFSITDNMAVVHCTVPVADPGSEQSVQDDVTESEILSSTI